jgi:riboflavin kinase/FMN adenylyltransferase
MHEVPAAARGSVATLGNFDGVHLGHQALLNRVLAEARARQLPSLVITFEPHPFEYFAGDQLTIPRLTRFREKFDLMSAMGIDYLMVLKFNQSLASLSASDFTQKILYESVGVKHLILGDDFHFGRGRTGNAALLKQAGLQLGFSVETLPTQAVGESRVSSTRVRAALKAGDLDGAKALLGRPFSLSGRVRLGAQLGRQWGFPTANIFLHRRLTPVSGIFTVLVHGLSDQPWPGVANVGTRPTVDGTRILLEVHLHHFNRNIYGQDVCVEFCQKLREEERFSSIDALREQIAKDVEVSSHYFKTLGLL